MIEIDDNSYKLAIKQLQQLAKQLDNKKLRKVLLKASHIYREEAQNAAPISKRIHYRYDTPKLAGVLKAPKGKGIVVARYHKGNLKRSIKPLAARRLIRAVMIGPKKAKGRSTTGVFQGNRTDGYYAPFVENDKPFLEPAWQRTRGAVVDQIARDISQILTSNIPTS